MALPTLEKTWQHNVNQSTVTSGNSYTDMRALMYKIKASLIGFGTTPWTVVSSSDGSANAGAADYWASATNCVWDNSGSNHSWIVLQQSGLNNFQVCIDLNMGTGNPNYCSIFVSYAAGFTGGSLTARPTATDEVTWFSTAQWVDISTPVDTVLHVMQSTTGENTRLYICSQSAVRACWFFEKLADSGLANPVVSHLRATITTFTEFYNGTRWTGKKGTTTFSAYTGSEYYYNTFVVNANSGAVSDISSAYPMTPLSAHSETATAKGRLGRFVDMWAGSSAFALAATYPAAPDNKQFIQLGQMIHPWGGTTPVIV